LRAKEKEILEKIRMGTSGPFKGPYTEIAIREYIKGVIGEKKD